MKNVASAVGFYAEVAFSMEQKGVTTSVLANSVVPLNCDITKID